jgi:hypothetical protein
MSQGDSQDSGTSSLEESILERYSKSADPPKKEEVNGGPEEAPSSLEEEILGRYSDVTEENPLPVKADELSEETAAGSQEEDILKRYSGSGSEDDLEVDEAVQGAPVAPLDEISDDPDSPELEEPPEERPAPVVQARVPRAAMPTSPEEVVEALRQLREDVGQISELSSEEGSIVAAFSLAFLKLMEPLTKALPVDTGVLPPGLGDVDKANVLPKGDLVVLYRDGRMESIDLADAENRDLLVTVVSDVTPRFNALIAKRRGKIEKRITFLSSVTKELQSIADSMVEVG